MPTETKKYKLTGEFSGPSEGANIWDSLPPGSHTLEFGSKNEALEFAIDHDFGPDEYGLSVIWGTKEVE